MRIVNGPYVQEENMIYETAYVLKNATSTDEAAKIKDQVISIINNAKGEVLVNDDWGLRTFAQPSSKGETSGHYFYIMYQADGTINTEIERRLKLSESVLKWLVVKLGIDSKKETIMKGYKNPNHKNEDEMAKDKDKKMSSKRRSCWFSANKTSPDWKNPATYKWLVNEFGKISPARVTSLRPRYQRQATVAIKRARNMGFISHLSNQVSERV